MKIQEIQESGKPVQAILRDLLVSVNGTWERGWSKAYKNRSPGGKVNYKLDGIRVPSEEKRSLKELIQQQLPSAVEIGVYNDMILVWFDTDPGIGPKIKPKAYAQRIATLRAEIQSLLAASGKSLEEVLSDLQ